MEIIKTPIQFKNAALIAIEQHIVFDKEVWSIAVDEVVQSIENAYIYGIEPTACQRLMGKILISFIEA